MTRQYQITRIKKPGGTDSPTDHIMEVYIEPKSIRNHESDLFDKAANDFVKALVDAPRWVTVEEVIQNIEIGAQYFYTDKAGNRAEVVVNQRHTLVNGRWVAGRKFIQTKADFIKIDNLLALPNDYGK